MRCPDGEEWDELRETLAHGVEMEVFAFRDVKAHLVEFEALMASDNFASAFALAEDEFGLASRLAACAKNIRAAPG
eukprot:1792028-Alexandrium_andersonii.AAC.1